ncbi:hypothetical protein ACHAW6_000912 [Cyclotella cf. meneghiniana]
MDWCWPPWRPPQALSMEDEFHFGGFIASIWSKTVEWQGSFSEWKMSMRTVGIWICHRWSLWLIGDCGSMPRVQGGVLKVSFV